MKYELLMYTNDVLRDFTYFTNLLRHDLFTMTYKIIFTYNKT